MGARPAQGEREVEIRECRSGNIDEVRRILEGSREAAQWSDQALLEALEVSPSYQFVSVAFEGVTGFVSGRVVGSEGEILNLAVKPEFRRRGVGQALVKAVLESFQRDGVVEVFLEVRESNQGALCFYEGLGFREVGRREAYYRDPQEAALLLARSIGPDSAAVC